MSKIIKLLALLFFMSLSKFCPAQKRITISILVDKILTQNKTLLTQLQNKIKSVVGQKAAITFKEVLENEFDPSKAKANYLSLLNDETDLILAFGVINNIVLFQEKSYPKPIILFGAVAEDFIDLPVDQKTTNINNITYLIAPLSYTKDLDVFRSVYEYKKVGIIVDEFLREALPVDSLFDSYFPKTGAAYKLISIKNGRDISSELDDIDGVYVAGGFYLHPNEFKTMIEEINSRNIPSFSAYGKEDVEKGVLATNQPETNLDQFFRRISLNVEAIIDGTNPADLPMFIEYKNQLSINYNTAKQIGFPLRYSLLGTADFVSGEEETTPEFSYSLLDLMKGVLNKNLLLKAERKNIDLSRLDLSIARSNSLPNISVSADGIYLDPKTAEISNGRNPELSTTANIFLEGVVYSENVRANINIKKNLLMAQREGYKAAELDAILNAAIAYFNALILKTNTQIQNQNLQVTKKNMKIAQQNLDTGESGKSDVLRFRSQLAQNTQSLIEASNALSQAFYTINELMNDPITKEIDIKDGEISKGLFKDYNYDDFLEVMDNPKLRPSLIKFLVQEAKKNAPELKNIDYNVSAVRRSYRLNNSGRYIPTISLKGQYNLTVLKLGKGSTTPEETPSLPDKTYNIALNLSLPVFQQNQRNFNRQIALRQEEKLNIQRTGIELSIEKKVNDIVLDLINQIANIQLSKVAEETAGESLELTQIAYTEGAVPIIQLIDAQTNYLKAQLASATANYNYLLTSLELERAIGYFFLMNDKASNQDFIQRANQFILDQN